MTKFVRSEEGFRAALTNIKWLAANHPDKEYVLFVDRRDPNFYGITLKGLFHIENVADGTAAHVVDADGNFTKVDENGTQNF